MHFDREDKYLDVYLDNTLKFYQKADKINLFGGFLDPKISNIVSKVGVKFWKIKNWEIFNKSKTPENKIDTYVYVFELIRIPIVDFARISFGGYCICVNLRKNGESFIIVSTINWHILEKLRFAHNWNLYCNFNS